MKSSFSKKPQTLQNSHLLSIGTWMDGMVKDAKGKREVSQIPVVPHEAVAEVSRRRKL